MSTQRESGTNSATFTDHALPPATPSTSSHGNTSHDHNARATSTPLPGYHGNTPVSHSELPGDLTVSPLNVDSGGESDHLSVTSMSISSDLDREVLEPGHIAVPILGYEVLEERARFSVFKIQVRQGPDDTYFIFRRYSDFDHLNTKLKEYFPHFRMALPPKKWFGDNFDKNFLEDRMIGLQAFLNNLVGNKDVCNSEPVRDFFCFDDPPGPHDSLEESRALCESLEEQVYCLHQQVEDRDTRLQILEDELHLSQIQVENLRKALKLERANVRRSSLSLPTMVEVGEDLPETSQTDQCPKVKVTSPTVSDGSISLTNSLTAIETIRMTTVTQPVSDTAVPSSDVIQQPDLIPRTKKHSGSSFKSASHSSSKSSHEGSSGYSSGSKSSNHESSSSQSFHEVAESQSADGSSSNERYLGDSGGDMTGPGQLYTTCSQGQISVSRVNASSSPRPKHRIRTPSGENETISPGAHSVDGSSRKRQPAVNTTKATLESATTHTATPNKHLKTNSPQIKQPVST